MALSKTAKKASEPDFKDEIHEELLFAREFSLIRNSEANQLIPIPTTVSFIPSTSLGKDPEDPGQLFLDYIPISSSSFSFDYHDYILSWKHFFGGGTIFFNRNGTVGSGIVGSGKDSVSVSTESYVEFVCNTADDVGATFITSGNTIKGINWDPKSSKWNEAQWSSKRLIMQYKMTEDSGMRPMLTEFFFDDFLTGLTDRVTSPEMDSSIDVGKRDDVTVWNLYYRRKQPFDDEKTYPTIIMPFLLNACEDLFVTRIDGAFIVNDDPGTTIVGLEGVIGSQALKGYYSVQEDKCPFSIFGSRLLIDGQAVADVRSYTRGNELHWSNLSQSLQEKLGLPASGTIAFNDIGTEGGVVGNAEIQVKKLSASQVHTALSNHNDVYPTLCKRLSGSIFSMIEVASNDVSQSLSIHDLNLMSTYRMKPDGWTNEVQNKAVEDMNKIIQSYIASDWWEKLFPNQMQPVLDGFLKNVAETPVRDDDGNIIDAAAWYRSLSTAQIVAALQHSSEESARILNGPRAVAWSQREVSNSKVYKSHSQMLYHHYFKQMEPLITSFLTDQERNPPQYLTEIDEERDLQLKELEDVVEYHEDKNKEELKEMIHELATYAKENKLYWAYYYLTYNTHSTILARINREIFALTGAKDSTVLMRMAQDGVSVLTALDPSGYFAMEYMRRVNAYVCTDVVLQMVDLSTTDMSVEIMRNCADEFIAKSTTTSNPYIIEAAKDIDEFMQSSSDIVLEDIIFALRSSSSSIPIGMSLSRSARTFENWFKEKYPKYLPKASTISTFFVGMQASMGMFGIIVGFTTWDEIGGPARAHLIVNTTNFTMQAVATTAKYGLKAYDFFMTGRLPSSEKLASLQKLARESIREIGNALSTGLRNLGNRVARWLQKVKGGLKGVGTALSKLGDKIVSRLPAVFGKNFDIFVAERLGPILSIVGIAFSIYSLTSSTGLNMVMDILAIVEGALGVFAAVAQAFISAGYAAATGTLAGMVSIAGPLGIVLAIAGFIVLLVSMFSKPPDPVKEFVDQLARPAGFAVSSPRNALDYAMPRESKKRGYDVVSITLATKSDASKVLFVDNAGTSFRPGDHSNSCLFATSTDGFGRSTITASLQSESTSELRHLCLMKDGTVQFTEAFDPITTELKDTVEQISWISAPTKDDAILDDDDLDEMNFSLAILSDGAPGRYLNASEDGKLSLSSNEQVWKLVLSGSKPVGMSMEEMTFVGGTTPMPMRFAPSFIIQVSTPATFSIDGELPQYLQLDEETGEVSTTGENIPNSAGITTLEISVENELGSDKTEMKIQVVSLSDDMTKTLH